MAADQVLTEAVAAFQAALGERFLAAYALGSLAHGGFSELVSDVDLGLLIRDPLEAGDENAIRAVVENQKRKGSPLHERLSVFWGTPATLRGERDGGRFPPLDRLDLIQNGRLLSGEDARHGLPAPSHRELLVAGARFALDYLAGTRPAGGDATEEIRDPDVLLGQGIRRVTKVVLFPVRFRYTAATGQIGTNHAAVASYLEDNRAPSTRLAAAALSWRTDPPADQSAASQLLRAELLPLYLHYIDDHIARLDSLAEVELATAFREWRDRLAP
ncbi:MAG: hypothetical protein ABSA93_18760 [Streptosporangiaceae bacterium]